MIERDTEWRLGVWAEHSHLSFIEQGQGKRVENTSDNEELQNKSSKS